MRRLFKMTVASVAAFFTILVISGTAMAATPSASSLTLSVNQPKAGSVDLSLSAQLAPSASGQKVTFFVQTQEFAGHGWMAVGSASTNSSGEATLTYIPTWTGSTEFGVAEGSSASVTSPVATKAFNVLKDPTGVPQSVIEYSRPLGTTGGWLVKGLLTTVAAIWVLLIGSLVLVVWRMPRLAALAGTDEKGKD